MTGLDVTVTLTPDQVEVIARRVAELLADRPAPAGDFVTVDDAARMLGVAVKTVRNMLADGRLPRHGGPRRPLVAVRDVRDLQAPRGAGFSRRAREVG